MVGWSPRSDAVNIVLVRHGQTSWNAEQRFLGQSDIPLDAVGHAQARALGGVLAGRFSRVYSSPLVRARATAEALNQPLAFDARLAELDQGALEGLRGEEAIARFPDFFRAWATDPAQVVVPGGESLLALQTRALAALDEIVAAAAPGDEIAVVTHQLVIASVTCWALGEPLSRWRAHGVPNVGLTVLAAGSSPWQVLARAVTIDAVAGS